MIRFVVPIRNNNPSKFPKIEDLRFKSQLRSGNVPMGGEKETPWVFDGKYP